MKKILIEELEKLTYEKKKTLLTRSKIDFEGLKDEILPIIEEIRSGGDRALYDLTEKYDKCRLTSLRVTKKEIENSFKEVDTELINIFNHIKKNLERYYIAERPVEWSTWVDKGIYSGMIYRPYERVGIYVPGGKALYPSIVLRMCVPALIAGVKDIVLCSPPDADGKLSHGVLMAAGILGIKEIYKLGGAQAVTAMAYGTETIKPVQKISAVGNAYVTGALKHLFGTVSIDKLAGPSDALVFVDSTADPMIVAANMIIELEHGPTSGAVVLVPTKDFALDVENNVNKLLCDVPERLVKIFSTSLFKYSAILIYKDIAEAIDFVNVYAPEHLQLTVRNHLEVMEKLNNVGAILLGEYTMISSADFFGGSSNVLPTGGMAKLFSGVSVFDFLKRIPFQYFTESGFNAISDKAEKLAKYQGMHYHAKAVNIRKKV